MTEPREKEKNAYTDLLGFLEEGELVEAIVFGPWGWNGYEEPDPVPVPHELFDEPLKLEDAKQYMRGWSFYSGFGSPQSYAVYIWTNRRIIWVTQYDGSTRLDSAPRNPIKIRPYMPGG